MLQNKEVLSIMQIRVIQLISAFLRENYVFWQIIRAQEIYSVSFNLIDTHNLFSST